jgi:hypothetical protein
VLAPQAVLQEVQRQEASLVLAATVLVFRRLSVEWGDVSMHLVFVIGSDLSFLNYNNRRSKLVAVYLDQGCQ